MRRQPPGTKRTDKLCPATTHFRLELHGQAALAFPIPHSRSCTPNSTIHQHPMWRRRPNVVREGVEPLDSVCSTRSATGPLRIRSEEHTSELQSLMRISYAVFCL